MWKWKYAASITRRDGKKQSRPGNVTHILICKYRLRNKPVHRYMIPVRNRQVPSSVPNMRYREKPKAAFLTEAQHNTEHCGGRNEQQ